MENGKWNGLGPLCFLPPQPSRPSPRNFLTPPPSLSITPSNLTHIPIPFSIFQSRKREKNKKRESLSLSLSPVLGGRALSQPFPGESFREFVFPDPTLPSLCVGQQTTTPTPYLDLDLDFLDRIKKRKKKERDNNSSLQQSAGE